MGDNPPPDKKTIWFPAKRYGWGWGLPCAWQGWVVLAAFIGTVAASAFLLLLKRPFVWAGCVVASCAIFLAICWVKGDKLRWRWGKD